MTKSCNKILSNRVPDKHVRLESHDGSFKRNWIQLLLNTPFTISKLSSSTFYVHYPNNLQLSPYTPDSILSVSVTRFQIDQGQPRCHWSPLLATKYSRTLSITDICIETTMMRCSQPQHCHFVTNTYLLLLLLSIFHLPTTTTTMSYLQLTAMATDEYVSPYKIDERLGLSVSTLSPCDKHLLPLSSSETSSKRTNVRFYSLQQWISTTACLPTRSMNDWSSQSASPFSNKNLLPSPSKSSSTNNRDVRSTAIDERHRRRVYFFIHGRWAYLSQIYSQKECLPTMITCLRIRSIWL